MAKPTIVTRAGKGSALTWTEGDANVTNLRDATITVKAGTGGTDVVNDLNGTVTLVAGTNVTISGDNTAKTVTINAAGGSGITDVVQDTTPQLGGDLDLNGFDITDTGATPLLITSNTDKNVAIRSQGTGDVVLLPLGSGKVIIDTLNWPTSDGTNNQVLTTNGSGQLSWSSASGMSDLVQDTTPQLGGHLDVNGKDIVSVSNGNINILPDGTGRIQLDVNYWPTSDGTANQVLKTDGFGQLSWTTVSSGGITDVVQDTTPQLGGALDVNGQAIVSVSNGNIDILPNGTGRIQLDVNYWPTADGSANQVLKTDGFGQLSWTTISSGISDVVSDTTPQLGGALDVNGNNIVSISNGNINIIPDGTGRIQLDVNYWPTADGSANQYLKTDGFGQLGWATLPAAFDPASPGAIGGTTASSGAFTTLSATTTSTSGAVNVTYNPTSASGAAIQATGKDSQGGTGYFDFLKTTNTTSGATNANKTFRTNSTGQLEIVNSAYNSVLLALTDAGNLQVPSISSSGSLSFKDTREAIYDLGTTGGTVAPNVANGSVQKITLNSALTINGFTSPVAGQSLTLIIYGGTSYTSITSTMKFAGGIKTLTGTAGCIDILSVYYDGTNYFASLGKGFA